MRHPTAGILAVLLLLPGASGLAGQRHAAADRAIAGSLLMAVPLPVSAAARWSDTLRLRALVRVEVQYSPQVAGDVASPRTIVGFRREAPGQDSSGWSAGVTGMRMALIRRPDGGMTPSAIELQLGGRSLGYLERRGRPDLGLELLLGLGNLDRPHSDFTVAIRTPVEWVLPAGPGRLLLSLAPTVAWGDVHIEGCVDDGPGDNCGSLGVQVEPGRTRFLLAGGLGFGVHPTGLTVSVGVERLLATGQEPRLALGLAWAY